MDEQQMLDALVAVLREQQERDTMYDLGWLDLDDLSQVCVDGYIDLRLMARSLVERMGAAAPV